MNDATVPTFSSGTEHVDQVDQVGSHAAPSSAAGPALDYTYVRMPDGSIQAVLTSAIVDATHGDGQVPTAVSDAPKPSAKPAVEAQFYVWLANGDVKRVKESDLPGVGGTNAIFGHWQEGNKVFTVVGVYPVEDVVTEGK